MSHRTQRIGIRGESFVNLKPTTDIPGVLSVTSESQVTAKGWRDSAQRLRVEAGAHANAEGFWSGELRPATEALQTLRVIAGADDSHLVLGYAYAGPAPSTSTGETTPAVDGLVVLGTLDW